MLLKIYLGTVIIAVISLLLVYFRMFLYRNEIKELIEIQRKIMENAWEYLKKGGIMVYSTCTVNKEENQENITWFLNKHKDAKIEKIFVGREENLRYDELGTLTIFPNQYMDGFFVTKIKKC